MSNCHPLSACALALLMVPGLRAQAPEPIRDAAELQQALDKLQVLGCVLYIAAHPDDENTAALAYFARGRHLRSAYLAMTRGGGGQNLIGPEQGDALALLRTQELLAARRLDGAEQYFTRAVDFGFSKTPEETFRFWGHAEALADVVWTIRSVRPDVIITRFSPTQGGTHGHHTASAQLALEAFSAAADPARFPEQLAYVRPWQAKRILWNSFRTEAERAAQAPGSYLTVDLGQYDPLLGKSYAELAAGSRSMHRSQGFGAVAVRGQRLDYLEPLAGAKAGSDPLDGVDLGWSRLPGGERVGALLARARQAYRPEHPAEILPLLFQARTALAALAPDPWVELKRAELLEAIRCAAGIWVEAVADRQSVAPGETLAVTAAVVARAAAGVTLEAIQEHPRGATLAVNQPVTELLQIPVAADAPPSQPYWLGQGPSEGRGPAAAPALAGLPEAPAPFSCRFRLAWEGNAFELTVPVRYRFRDPVLGERYQPVAVVPAVMVNLAEPVQVFGDGGAREIALVAIAGRKAEGVLKLQVPPGWQVQPELVPFNLAQAGDELRRTVRLTPPATAQEGELRVQVALDGHSSPALGRVRVDYPHVPLQTFFPPAVAKVVRLDLHLGGRRIGYLMGPGDEVPRSLKPLGYQVELLSDEDLASANLDRFDAIIVGIRAFNTRPRLAQLKDRLLDYVARGGTEVVQYNVDQGLVTPALGPFPFTVARTRVCEESAAVTLLEPGNPLLNRPNRIGPEDFQGWVQERGLYFAKDWDPRYTPLLSCHDSGEPASGGALLVAQHGRGRFVYTGLSFFRQLPAGVPGAYRLFANLLARDHD
jgi:LmbE family N-acetylglucosaminyl deacetylase